MYRCKEPSTSQILLCNRMNPVKCSACVVSKKYYWMRNSFLRNTPISQNPSLEFHGIWHENTLENSNWSIETVIFSDQRIKGFRENGEWKAVSKTVFSHLNPLTRGVFLPKMRFVDTLVVFSLDLCQISVNLAVRKCICNTTACSSCH